MKNVPFTRMLCVLAAWAMPAARAAAWGPSAHAWLVRQSLGPDADDAPVGFAVLGSVTPDFFWYMADTGAIGYETAYRLHGVTEAPCVLDSTIFFYEFFSATYAEGDVRMAYMAEGIRTHVYADVAVHNTLNGWVEGQGMWVDALRKKTGIADREALHLAVEFAVDSLLVRAFGPQLGSTDTGMLPDELPALRQFEEYFSLLRTMEALAGVYGAYLLRMDENPPASGSHYSEALPATASPYARAAVVLLRYPREILETVTSGGMNWEEALTEVVASLAQ